MKRLTTCAALAASLLLAGCGGESKKKQFVVAFSQANNAEPYRAAQNAFLTQLFAQQPDVKLVISDAQQDNSKQVAQVETFIRQKPDLLIVAPNERAALTAVMGQAVEAKIPVICLERDILQPNYTSYVQRQRSHQPPRGPVHRRSFDEKIRQARGQRGRHARPLRCGRGDQSRSRGEGGTR